MKTRLATIAALSLAAVIGTASAAQAAPPKGPGNMSPAPTTTAPKGPDKVAPTPTTQPPKGPGDLATPTTQPPQPGPQGPGDLGTPAPDPVVDPKPQPGPQDGPGDKIAPKPKSDDDGCPACPAGEVPDSPDSGNGNGGSSTDTDESIVEGKSVETVPVANSEAPASNDDSTEAAAAADHDGGLSPFVLLGFAILTAGLIAFVVARRRNDEEDAEQF